MLIREMMKEVYENAKAHGWWDSPREIPELLCLVHSEVSEALEAYRKDDKLNFAEELADICIRVFDLAEAFKVDLETSIKEKHEFNKTRPYRHGGKKC